MRSSISSTNADCARISIVNRQRRSRRKQLKRGWPCHPARSCHLSEPPKQWKSSGLKGLASEEVPIKWLATSPMWLSTTRTESKLRRWLLTRSRWIWNWIGMYCRRSHLKRCEPASREFESFNFQKWKHKNGIFLRVIYWTGHCRCRDARRLSQRDLSINFWIFIFLQKYGSINPKVTCFISFDRKKKKNQII